jgi:hypothetical protein
LSKISDLILIHNSLSDTIELYFVNEDLKLFLSSLPAHARTWSKKKGCWVIVPETLHKVISYSRHIFTKIDANALPIRYQNAIQRALQGGEDTLQYSSEPDSPYSVLYITRNAPDFVVKAVFKALVFEYHPDKGGDPKEFQKVKEAYDEITKGPS